MKLQRNITNTNTRITELADILQKARGRLSFDNKNIDLNIDETRRIILVCLIYFRTQGLVNNESLSLANVFEKLNLTNSQVFDLCADNKFKIVDVSGALKEISNISQYSDWKNLINYAFEALEYDVDAYFEIKISRGIRKFNSKKKSCGIYYTPIDVVDFIVA